MIQLQAINYILDSQDTSFIFDNNLDETFFPELKSEFNFIKNHIIKFGNVPDKVTFKNAFMDFQLAKTTETPDYLIKELFEDKNVRELIERMHSMSDSLNAGKNAEALQIYKEGNDLLRESTPLTAVDILHDTSRYDEYLDKLESHADYFVTTGFPQLDEMIGGWDRHEELATIVARTNVGKSWILMKCAQAAAQAGLRVGYYSGEMSENKVGYRMDTWIGHISNSSLTKGREDVQLEYQKYIESLADITKTQANWKEGGSIFVLTPNMAGGEVTVSTLRAFIDKYKLDMLCIDQHSLLSDDRKAKNPVDRASNISRDLKMLQVMKRIPIISVSQQNRSSTENGVDSSHVAQSDRISQDSTILIFLSQEKVEGVPTTRMNMELGKSRDSANKKKLSYVMNLDLGTFEYDEETTNIMNDGGSTSTPNNEDESISYNTNEGAYF